MIKPFMPCFMYDSKIYMSVICISSAEGDQAFKSIRFREAKEPALVSKTLRPTKSLVVS